MYKYQILPKDEIINALLCFADRISCSYCPCKEECLELDKHEIGLSCEKMIIRNLTGEIEVSKSCEFFDGFNEGFSAGYEACKKAIIDKLQKGRMKNNEDSR